LFAEESAKRPVGLSAGRRARRTPERKEACLERLIVEGLPDHLRHEDEGVLAVRTGTGVQIFAGCQDDGARRQTSSWEAVSAP
jgi:hypothetical protein